jgi:regulator of sirC expression with transglutaminase-like and TPR domain
VPFSLNLQPRAAQVARELEAALNAPGEELAPAALAVARVEYPSLDSSHYVSQLDRLGDEAASRIERARPGGGDGAIRALNEYLYDELRFSGNRRRYDDPRNSFLNEVLERRTGIPLTLAVVYLEVARRAGVRVSGVNFPGHFLLRAPLDRGVSGLDEGEFLIVDPFHGGARLSESDCRELLCQHVGEAAAYDAHLLAPATRHDIVVRMLVNLKRLYVRMRSFPHARFISDLLVTADPSALTELRDRGLLAYHLEDFAAALRDLEAYLRLSPRTSPQEDTEPTNSENRDDTQQENAQIWEHVKTLRKRVAGLN